MKQNRRRPDVPGSRVFAAGIAASVLIHSLVLAFGSLSVPAPPDRTATVTILPPPAIPSRLAESAKPLPLQIVRLADADAAPARRAAPPAGGAAAPAPDAAARAGATGAGARDAGTPSVVAQAKGDTPGARLPAASADAGPAAGIVLAAAGTAGAGSRAVAVTELEAVGGRNGDTAADEAARSNGSGRRGSRIGISVELGGDGCIITGRRLPQTGPRTAIPRGPGPRRGWR